MKTQLKIKLKKLYQYCKILLSYYMYVSYLSCGGVSQCSRFFLYIALCSAAKSLFFSASSAPGITGFGGLSD